MNHTRPARTARAPAAKHLRAALKGLLLAAACLAGVALLAALVVLAERRGLLPAPAGPPGFAAEAPAEGGPAPDFALRDVDGVPFRLVEARGAPVVIEFGSLT